MDAIGNGQLAVVFATRPVGFSGNGNEFRMDEFRTTSVRLRRFRTNEFRIKGFRLKDFRMEGLIKDGFRREGFRIQDSGCRDLKWKALDGGVENTQ